MSQIVDELVTTNCTSATSLYVRHTNGVIATIP